MIAVAIAWLALLYGASWHLLGGSSDNAAPILAGRDMVHGNVFLHGWHLPADSYWLLDLPVLGLGSTFGLGPGTFHFVPTAIAAATVLVAARCAARHMNRRNAAVAAVATFLVLGLPSSLFAAFFLQGPLHVMTALVCLLAFGLLAPGRSRRCQIGGAALLLIAVSADPLTLLIGAVPVLIAGLAVIRTRDLEDGLPVVVASVVASAGGEGLARAVAALGGFRRIPTLPLAAISQWVPNLRLALHDFFYLFGVRVLPSWPHVAWPVRIVHIAGLAFAGSALALGLVDLVRRLLGRRCRGAWIDDVCLVGFFGSVAFFVIVVFPGENVSRIRYLLPAMVFAAILAGRLAGVLIGPVLDRATDRATTHAQAPRAVRALALGVAVVLVAGYAAETGASTRTQNPPNREIALAEWLSAHRLTEGWGGYWHAAVTTVVSDNTVRIRPVIGVRGRLHGFGNFAADTWFDLSSNRRPSTFLVYEPSSPWGDVNLVTATATFGEPLQRMRFRSFEILIWDHDTRAQLLQPLVVR